MSRWFRILAPCPQCARLPALHVPEWLMQVAATKDEDEPVIDVQCQNRKCVDLFGKRTTFVIAAHAVLRAEPINKAA